MGFSAQHWRIARVVADLPGPGTGSTGRRCMDERDWKSVKDIVQVFPCTAKCQVKIAHTG